MSKAKKSKAKSRVSAARKADRSKRKPLARGLKARKAKGMDENQRALILAVVDKLGASCAIYKDNPDQLMVSRFNAAPFIIDYKTARVIEVGLRRSEDTDAA